MKRRKTNPITATRRKGTSKTALSRGTKETEYAATAQKSLPLLAIRFSDHFTVRLACCWLIQVDNFDIVIQAVIAETQDAFVVLDEIDLGPEFAFHFFDEDIVTVDQ